MSSVWTLNAKSIFRLGFRFVGLAGLRLSLCAAVVSSALPAFALTQSAPQSAVQTVNQIFPPVPQASPQPPPQWVPQLPPQLPTQLPPQAPQTPEKLAQVLKFVFDNEALKYGWPANYRALWCPSNVFNLLRRLDEAKVNLANARVLYIIPVYYVSHQGEAEIRPRAARIGRDGPTREWTFHVVLQVENKILDLDFTNDPVIVETSEYFARMFGQGPLATQKSKQTLYFRSIPAADYLVSYTGNWEWFLAGGGGRFAPQNLSGLFPDVGPAAPAQQP